MAGGEQYIQRGRHLSGFSVLSNKIFEDESLSVEAKGTLGYLLSRPPNWRVRVTQVARKLKIGRDRLYRILNEIKEAGYLDRRQGRKRRTFGTVSYFVRDVAVLSQPDFQEAEDQDTDPQEAENPEALIRNETSTNTDFKKATAANKGPRVNSTSLRCAKTAGLSDEGSWRSERPEVVQARVALRLGGGDAEKGWLLFGALSDDKRDSITAMERGGRLTDRTLETLRLYLKSHPGPRTLGECNAE